MVGNIKKSTANIETMFAEGYALCAEHGVSLPPQELRRSILQTAHNAYGGAHADDFAAAYLAFYLFRDMHSRTDDAYPITTLLGDYFFSLFSKFLIPVDSVPLIDAFSKYLSAQTTETAGGCETEASRIITSGGKRLRPSLAAICYRMSKRTCKAATGDSSVPILPLMNMLELMHTTSLIHDDVVDHAQLRRGTKTINATSGSAFAVQSGDYLLAKAMRHLHYYRGTGINETLAGVSADMCLGEFQQKRSAFDLNAQSEYLYLLQIKRKTASLLAASCYCGALAGGMNAEKAAALKRFGEYFGAAFQILDDLLDYEGSPGKAAGQDLRNGIFTLPVLILKDKFPADVRTRLISKDKREADIRCIIDYIETTNAPELTWERIIRLCDEACKALTAFDDCPERDALIQLANSITRFSSDKEDRHNEQDISHRNGRGQRKWAGNDSES
ncbi:MAG: polyprenyl synthetase family protein, partial [Clostridiales Family XIII bacterium]|nr:polyprenyl synthetase family protein [Clostridiales Family XIII bacterium]